MVHDTTTKGDQRSPTKRRVIVMTLYTNIDTAHTLLTQHIRDALEPVGDWSSYLHMDDTSKRHALYDEIEAFGAMLTSVLPAGAVYDEKRLLYIPNEVPYYCTDLTTRDYEASNYAPPSSFMDVSIVPTVHLSDTMGEVVVGFGRHLKGLSMCKAIYTIRVNGVFNNISGTITGLLEQVGYSLRSAQCNTCHYYCDDGFCGQGLQLYTGTCSQYDGQRAATCLP